MSEVPYFSFVAPAYRAARAESPTLTALTGYFRDFTRENERLIAIGECSNGTLEIAARQAAQQAHFQRAAAASVDRGRLVEWPDGRRRGENALPKRGLVSVWNDKTARRTRPPAISAAKGG